MSAERDFAEEIYDEIRSERTTNIAFALFQEDPGQTERERFGRALHYAIASVIDAVLARRQSEAARAGPWGDYEEEDGYPGSLLPPKRGTP